MVLSTSRMRQRLPLRYRQGGADSLSFDPSQLPGQAVSPSPVENARQACERILRAEQAYNTAHHILPGENAVAARLLGRGLELADAYEELQDKLGSHPNALQAFLGIVLSTASQWSPEKIAEARTARSELAGVNRQISVKAAELASLLDQRDTLHNTTGFSSPAHYHVVDVIEAVAARTRNHRFTVYVKDRLDALRGQFDMKYWPTLGEFAQEIAIDAGGANPEASDPLTAAATASTRPSLADFFRALFAAIEENAARHHGPLPTQFRVSDATLAALANCALDLGPDDPVEGTYVKRLRQRDRAGVESAGN